MYTKLLVRIDDVHPMMNIDRFLDFIDFLESLNLYALLGVIPDCKDVKLNAFEVYPDFFGLICSLQERGHEIAQHGCHHVYTKPSRGIFLSTPQSEFAGLDYSAQYELLSHGKSILESNGIKTNVFMAPNHSLDLVTLDCLRSLGFQYVTDGYGFFPFTYRSLKFVPQINASGINIGFGIATICVHLCFLSEADYRSLKLSISNNSYRFRSFYQIANSCTLPSFLGQPINICLNSLVFTFRRLRDLFS